MSDTSVIERRTVSGQVRAVATEAGPTLLSGYAALFDTEAVIHDWVPFRETIRKGSFTDALKRDDVRATFNHSADRVLGRTSNGTLRLREDERGLHYDIDLNQADSEAMSVGAKVARGDVSQSSFAFQVDEERWEYPKGEMPRRTILRVSPLIDVSVVTYPAYEATTVSARARELATAEIGTGPSLFSADPQSRARELRLRQREAV